MKKKYTYTLFLAIVLSGKLIAQIPDSHEPKHDLFIHTSEKWDSLLELNADIVIEIHPGNHSGIFMVKETNYTCLCEGNNLQKFFIWSIKDNFFIQKITCCKVYSPEQFLSNNIFKVLNRNLDILGNEKYRKNSFAVTDFIQLRYYEKDKIDRTIYFDYYLVNKKLEPDNWKFNKKLKTHKVLRKLLRITTRLWKSKK